jgi:hypothetical protein
MVQIKDIWISEHSAGFYNICIRYDGCEYPNDPSDYNRELNVRRSILPPVDERKLSLEEAKKLGEEEAHFIIGPFSLESLHQLGLQFL